MSEATDESEVRALLAAAGGTQPGEERMIELMLEQPYRQAAVDRAVEWMRDAGPIISFRHGKEGFLDAFIEAFSELAWSERLRAMREVEAGLRREQIRISASGVPITPRSA